MLVCAIGGVLPRRFLYRCLDELAQYWGTEELTAHHPPVHTLIMGSFSRLGKALGSANLGLFLFALLQTLAFALVIAHVFCLYEKLKQAENELATLEEQMEQNG